MIDLEDIFDKYELELEFKFIDFEHKITAMFEAHINNLKSNNYGRLYESDGSSSMRDHRTRNG